MDKNTYCMVNTIARRILLCLAAIAGLMAGTVSLVAVAANPTAVSSGSEAVISGIFRNSARTGRAVVPDSPLPSGFRVPSGMEEYTSPAYAAVQDTSRFLWIGTDSGLLKYDGYDVYSYTFIPGDSRFLVLQFHDFPDFLPVHMTFIQQGSKIYRTAVANGPLPDFHSGYGKCRGLVFHRQFRHNQLG